MDRSREHSSEVVGVSSVPLKDDVEASRVTGKQGSARSRIEKATGTHLSLQDNSTRLEIHGTEKQRRIASIIVRCMTHRRGDVPVSSAEVSESCSVLTIPKSTIKMVLGKGGEHINSIQAENETAMFLACVTDRKADHDSGTVIVFGGRHGRRLSILLVMSLVDSIVKGYFTSAWHERKETFDTPADLDGDWGTSVLEFQNDDEMAYVIGKNGSTRTKLMKASCCAISRVGTLLYISGPKQQRVYAEEYIYWLLDGRDRDIGYVGIANPEDRKDCALVCVPDSCVGWVTGAHRQALNKLEEAWDVMIFVLTEKPSEDSQTFAIFGPVRSRFGAELGLQEHIESQLPGYISNRLPTKKTVSDVRGFARDYWPLDDQQSSYVFGKQGATKKKLMLASNATIMFMGNVCVVGGERHERTRCLDYIEWILSILTGDTLSIDSGGRSDITEIVLHTDQKQLLTAAVLRDLEIQSDTLVLLARNKDGQDCLFICSHDRGSPCIDKGRIAVERAASKLLSGQTSSVHFSSHERSHATDRAWNKSHPSVAVTTHSENRSWDKSRDATDRSWNKSHSSGADTTHSENRSWDKSSDVTDRSWNKSHSSGADTHSENRSSATNSWNSSHSSKPEDDAWSSSHPVKRAGTWSSSQPAVHEQSRPAKRRTLAASISNLESENRSGANSWSQSWKEAHSSTADITQSEKWSRTESWHSAAASPSDTSHSQKWSTAASWKSPRSAVTDPTCSSSWSSADWKDNRADSSKQNLTHASDWSKKSNDWSQAPRSADWKDRPTDSSKQNVTHSSDWSKTSKDWSQDPQSWNKKPEPVLPVAAATEAPKPRDLRRPAQKLGLKPPQPPQHAPVPKLSLKSPQPPQGSTSAVVDALQKLKSTRPAQDDRVLLPASSKASAAFRTTCQDAHDDLCLLPSPPKASQPPPRPSQAPFLSRASAPESPPPGDLGREPASPPLGDLAPPPGRWSPGRASEAKIKARPSTARERSRSPSMDPWEPWDLLCAEP